MNILDLLQQEGITAKKVSGTRGGEYASACPVCGGSDRFRVWPSQNEGGKWWCRQCNKGGDRIQYLRDLRGKSYKEACLILDIEPAGRKAIRNTTPKCSPKSSWTPAAISPPCSSWTTNALSFLTWAESQLYLGKFSHVVAWLNGRGLTVETIKGARLGWNPKNWWVRREEWGLFPETKEDGSEKKLWIPEGLVIPCFRKCEIQRIRIRRPNPDASPKYYFLPGSANSSMLMGKPELAYVVVESELDSLLIDQEAGDLIQSVALGSANIRPDSEVTRLLTGAELVLVALDSDDAGGKGSWQWWMQAFPNARRWPVLKGKDPTEAHQNGFKIRSWISAALEKFVSLSNKPDSNSIETASKLQDEPNQPGEDSTRSELATFFLGDISAGGFYSRFWPNVQKWAKGQLTALEFEEVDQAFRRGAACAS